MVGVRGDFAAPEHSALILLSLAIELGCKRFFRRLFRRRRWYMETRDRWYVWGVIAGWGAFGAFILRAFYFVEQMKSESPEERLEDEDNAI